MSTKNSAKSKFVAGCQCLKRLYWQVHEPELAAQPDGATEAIMQQGHDVGMLARRLFPGGVEVCERSLDQAIRATRELVANQKSRRSSKEYSNTMEFSSGWMSCNAAKETSGVSWR